MSRSPYRPVAPAWPLQSVEPTNLWAERPNVRSASLPRGMDMLLPAVRVTVWDRRAFKISGVGAPEPLPRT